MLRLMFAEGYLSCQTRDEYGIILRSGRRLITAAMREGPTLGLAVDQYE